MITLYSGNGKGKTLACIGATVKASIKDKKVLFVDFINKDYVSELKAHFVPQPGFSANIHTDNP